MLLLGFKSHPFFQVQGFPSAVAMSTTPAVTKTAVKHMKNSHMTHTKCLLPYRLCKHVHLNVRGHMC